MTAGTPGASSGNDVLDGAFASVEDVVTRFAEHGYLADQRLATTVFLQAALEKPVLLEGPAGVGKTQLAKSLAEVTGRPLLRLQCYEGQDESTALYEWDYGKQLLYTQLLREKIGQIVGDATSIEEAVNRISAEDSVFFSERFLAPRPLLDAVRSDAPVVLLIDEVDRADEALEAVLLELLAEYQVSVPELGTYRAKHIPYVVLTSNNTRDLSAALKRRCLHLSLDYPDADRELDIIRSKNTGLPEALARTLVDIVRQLRELDLRKAPSISETIDWARTLAVLGAKELTAELLSQTANVVVKYDRDLRRTLEVLPKLIDPNATVPNSRHRSDAHGHSHGSGHSHDDDHSHGDHSHGDDPNDDHSHGDDSHEDSHGDDSHDDHSHGADHDRPRVDPDPAPVSDPAGVEKRAAKDEPGRHNAPNYGIAPSERTPSVARGQGERSFNTRGARRRPV